MTALFSNRVARTDAPLELVQHNTVSCGAAYCILRQNSLVLHTLVQKVLGALLSLHPPLPRLSPRSLSPRRLLPSRPPHNPPPLPCPALAQAEFERVLHPVFEEDEWILISIGTLLGALAGAAQARCGML